MIASLAGLLAAPVVAAASATVPQENAIAIIIEFKVILRQKGRFLGQGSEFGYNEHGHPKILKRVIEPDRYLTGS